MTTDQLTELRHDITARNTIAYESGRRLTNLELRMYQKMMKKVNDADRFIKKSKAN